MQRFSICLGPRGLEASVITLSWNANILQFSLCLQLGRKSKQTSKQIKAMQRADKRAAERERPKSFPSDDDEDKTSEAGQCDDRVGSASASCSHCAWRKATKTFFPLPRVPKQPCLLWHMLSAASKCSSVPWPWSQI